MVRTVLYLLLAVFLIALVRGIIGVLTKGVAGLFEDGQRRSAQAKGGFGGELKQDPVCGTYVSTNAALSKTVAGTTHYFCSPACRDRFGVTAS
jgi:YHS domain-containing protein